MTPPDWRARLRTVLLAGSALTFLAIAIASIVAPRMVAAQYGYPLDRFEAYNEFRGIFTGFWSGLAVLLGTAARRIELTILGDLCGLMILLQACGRVLSVAVDGVPDARFLGALAAEAVTGIGILALRPRRTR